MITIAVVATTKEEAKEWIRDHISGNETVNYIPCTSVQDTLGRKFDTVVITSQDVSTEQLHRTLDRLL